MQKLAFDTALGAATAGLLNGAGRGVQYLKGKWERAVPLGETPQRTAPAPGPEGAGEGIVDGFEATFPDYADEVASHAIPQHTITYNSAKTQLLNQFNSPESLIQSARNLGPVRGAIQGFIKGDGNAIFKSLTQNGKSLPNGRFLLPDGTNIGKHFSSYTGEFTINMNRGNQIFKIRINP